MTSKSPYACHRYATLRRLLGKIQRFFYEKCENLVSTITFVAKTPYSCIANASQTTGLHNRHTIGLSQRVKSFYFARYGGRASHMLA